MRLDRLPPLSSLRIFESAGRHGSFKRAAEELYLTPSAVSRSIRTLEEHLGLALFRRYNRALKLTDQGEAYLAVVREAFETLARGTAALKHQGRRRLVLSLPFSLASHFLLPRLGDFEQRHPGIDIVMETSNQLANLENGSADMAIRMTENPWPGLESFRLFDLHLFPVCSPSLLQSNDNPLNSIADIKNHTIINVAIAMDAWRIWLKAAGFPDLEPRREIRLDNQQVAIDAAIQGLGLAIGAHPLVTGLIASGRLVQPFQLTAPSPKTYWLVHRPQDRDDPAIVAFRQWLISAIKLALS